MKIFAIRDADNNLEEAKEKEPQKDLGYFFYFEKTGEYYIELIEGTDEWDLPFILDSFARKEKWTVDPYYTRLFICQRIVPSDRQNIGAVLKENGLEVYDEARLFILADGRCAQDECYITQISYEDLPDSIKKRRRCILLSAAPLDDTEYLVSFADDHTGILELKDCVSDYKWMDRLLAYQDGLKETEVSTAGTAMSFTNGQYLPYDYVYKKANMLPVCFSALERLTRNTMMSTQDMVDNLGCTRQNINDLVKRGRIRPMDMNAKVQFFSRKDYYNLL